MPGFDEQIDVRRGDGADETPTEFLWRGRLWRVREVVSHWVESGPWWTSPGVRTVVSAEGSSQDAIEAIGGAGETGEGVRCGVATLDHPLDHPLDQVLDDVLAETEIWRVEAHWPPSGGRQARPPLALGETGFGVFDLVLSRTTRCWRLTGCED